MEFLWLSRRRSSARNVPSGEKRGETDVFAGYDSIWPLDKVDMFRGKFACSEDEKYIYIYIYIYI